MIASRPLGDGVDGVYERIEYDYNRQGQVIEMKDPNETVHQYQFDGLGRATEDAVTAFGTGIDQTVKRIEITYDSKRSLRTKVTQYDAATGGSVVNEVEFAYNDFRQLSDDKQEHDGAVDGNTLKVSYGYEDGDEANSIRRTSMTYPNGRVLDYQYGTADGANDSLSRVESLQINGETPKLCTYTYVGVARYVKIAYPEPNVELSYFKESGAPDGDAGDKYAGYDRFGRTVDMRWIATTGGAVKDRVQYGYDRAGNRTWRRNLAATDGGQDNSYQYDGLYQVQQAAKGNLNLNQTAISAIPAEDETFSYDPTGNWTGYRREEDGVEELDQSRVSNQDNQITQIDGDSDGIAHDRAGNTTKMPPDASGDWSKHFQLTWDGWNRLVEVKDENDGSVATYQYDGLYRRTTKTASGETRHFYYNDQWKTVEERVDAGTSSSSLSSSSGAEETEQQYFWGMRPDHRDELIRRDRSDTGTLDEKLYCLMDYFNPTSMVSASGAVQERYTFSAFGLRATMDADWISRTSSSFDINFAFHGQFLDVETQYYNYGFRLYSPNIGRWLSRDPIRERGGVNVYRFSDNAATNSVDKLGLNPTAPWQVINEAAKGSIGAFEATWNGYFEKVQKGAANPLRQIATPRIEYGGFVCARCTDDAQYEVISTGVSPGNLNEWSPLTAKNKCRGEWIDIAFYHSHPTTTTFSVPEPAEGKLGDIGKAERQKLGVAVGRAKKILFSETDVQDPKRPLATIDIDFEQATAMVFEFAVPHLNIWPAKTEYSIASKLGGVEGVPNGIAVNRGGIIEKSEPFGCCNREEFNNLPLLKKRELFWASANY